MYQFIFGQRAEIIPAVARVMAALQLATPIHVIVPRPVQNYDHRAQSGVSSDELSGFCGTPDPLSERGPVRTAAETIGTGHRKRRYRVLAERAHPTAVLIRGDRHSWPGRNRRQQAGRVPVFHMEGRATCGCRHARFRRMKQPAASTITSLTSTWPTARKSREMTSGGSNFPPIGSSTTGSSDVRSAGALQGQGGAVKRYPSAG
jgi:UDP-N-acetylglucosamine 2-epimerase